MFTLTLVTPEKKILVDAEVDEVIVNGSRGGLDILPGHAPLMTTLQPGVLRFKPKNSSKYTKAALSWGYCEVNPKGINILAETCEMPQEIDSQRAKLALETASKRLKEAGLAPEEYMNLQKKIDKAQVRISLADKNQN